MFRTRDLAELLKDSKSSGQQRNIWWRNTWSAITLRSGERL
jgi:hypothetical protein